MPLNREGGASFLGVGARPNEFGRLPKLIGAGGRDDWGFRQRPTFNPSWCHLQDNSATACLSGISSDADGYQILFHLSYVAYLSSFFMQRYKLILEDPNVLQEN